MRIMHTSDWHVGKKIRGLSRHREHLAVFAQMRDIIEEDKPDLLLVAGDTFDHGNPGPDAEKVAYDALVGFADMGIPVITLPGNHDSANRWAAMTDMLARSGVTVVAHPTAPDKGGVLKVNTNGGEATIGMLPFVSLRNIIKIADLVEMDDGETGQEYEDHIRRIIEALSGQFGSGSSADILMSHLTVVGSAGVKLGGGERKAHTIFEYFLSPQVFPSTAHYVALGHLHQQQNIPGPTQIRYSGAPMHLDFGEVPSDRGVLIVDCEANQPAQVSHRPITAGRRLATLKGSAEQIIAAAAEMDDTTFIRAMVTEKPRPGLRENIMEALDQTTFVVLDHKPETNREDDALMERLSADGVTPSVMFGEYLDVVDLEDKGSDSLMKRFTELFEQQAAVEVNDNVDMDEAAA